MRVWIYHQEWDRKDRPYGFYIYHVGRVMTHDNGEVWLNHYGEEEPFRKIKPGTLTVAARDD